MPRFKSFGSTNRGNYKDAAVELVTVNRHRLKMLLRLKDDPHKKATILLDEQDIYQTYEQLLRDWITPAECPALRELRDIGVLAEEAIKRAEGDPVLAGHRLRDWAAKWLIQDAARHTSYTCTWCSSVVAERLRAFAAETERDD
jgi:hypothetical protein